MLRFNFKRFRQLFKRKSQVLVIPVVNCETLDCIKKHFEIIEKAGFRDIHIDVSDGKFSPVKLFYDDDSFSFLASQAKKFFIEAHLMVSDPIGEIEKWAKIGIRRIIIHAEKVSLHGFANTFFELKKKYPKLQIGVSVLPNTDAEYAVPYVAICGFVQILSVNPGFSGQKFVQGSIEKIEYLRRDIPPCIIEIDGGIDENTARRAKLAGADILVSGSYIFSSPDPKEAYMKLKEA